MIKQKIAALDYAALPISDYSRQYLLRMLPCLDYYEEIFNRVLDRALRQVDKPLPQVTLVDYGGGHGMLSLMAKERGVGTVLYVDNNSQAVQTVQALGFQVGYLPDVVLQGDAHTLRQWCNSHDIHPDIVVGTDVIEHIYSLEAFFADLFALRSDMPMLFTTASNPDNRRIVRRLHRIMLADELGHADQPGFYELRRRHIARNFPTLGKAELDFWATATRGLNFSDTLSAVDTHNPPLLAATASDPYNTCDPTTGSWTERILTLDQYRHLLQPFGAQLTVSNGHYNTHRSLLASLASLLLNGLLSTGLGRRWAPYIILAINCA